MDYSRAAHRWLDAYTDPRASLYTFGRCMELADLHSDGDYKLILADLGTGSSNIKLKVYKGTSLMSETTLLEIPTGLATFYNEQRDGRCPAIAVASGSNIFVYKNMKPYFKISVPRLPVNPLEIDLWIQARNGELTAKALHELLGNIKTEIGFPNMSYQSQRLLMVNAENESELERVKASHCSQPVERQTVVTCVTTLRKSVDAKTSVSCIVFGTENGFIYIVDTEAFTILDSVCQSSESRKTDQTVPVIVSAMGLYDVDYRIVTCNRDGRITLLRKGWKQVKVMVSLSVQVVDMCLMKDTGNIVLGNMNATMECYSRKGRKLWNVKLPTNIMSMIAVPLAHQSLTLIAVALAGGKICFYNGRQLVDTIVAADTIAGMIFGRFGQEDHCLVLVTIGGTLQVKMLKRTAQFSTAEPSAAPTAAVNHGIKLPIAKKSRIFLEHALREKENFLYIHQTFQRDLHRMRLRAAREFAESLAKTNNLISNDTKLPLKLSAQVFGLGPTFKIVVTLENMSPTSDAIDALLTNELRIVYDFDEKVYDVERPFARVPLLVPGLTYKFETMLRTAATDAMIADEVRVFVTSPSDTKPVLSAAVRVPVCDVLPAEV